MIIEPAPEFCVEISWEDGIGHRDFYAPLQEALQSLIEAWKRKDLKSVYVCGWGTSHLVYKKGGIDG